MKINTRHIQDYRNHLEALCLLAGGLKWFEGERLYSKLHRIEAKAHRQAEYECNIGLTEEESAAADARITKSVQKAFGGTLPVGFFINGDPRGYSLKIKDGNVPEGIHKDFGGYGILAPDFN